MSEVHAHLRVFREETMLPHFRPLVVGEGPPQLSRQRPQFAPEGLPHRGRILGSQGCQHSKSRGPLHQGAERRGIGMADQQVALPMPRHRARGNLLGPFVNTDQILNGPRRQADLVRSTKAVAAAKIPGEFPLQGAAGQHIEIGIDGFMGDAHRRVVRIPLRQAVRNLLERPAVREQVQDGGAQARVDGERSRLARLVGPALRPLMGGHRSIGDRRRPMAREFTRQGTRSSLHDLGGGAEARARRQHTTQFFALHETQASVSFHVQLLRSWSDQDTGVALEP
jgi:hypothetical protein